MSPFDYDIVILGSGMGGSLTAILCRAIGLRVLMVEKDDHPRFVIGESVTGEVMRRLDYLARRYNVPFLVQLSSYSRIKRAGLPIATWPRTHGTFVWHEEGKRVDSTDPQEIVQQASVWPLGPDAHVYRPDFDLFLKNSAVERGVSYLPNTEAVSYRFVASSGSAITLNTRGAAPRTVTCRLLIDATGPACWLSRELGHFRDDSRDVPMASATVFAHFRNVRKWEDVLGARPMMFPRDHGTVLHVGAHGMLWVIPFDNGITSVGWVTSDTLPPDQDAETLFWETVRSRPSLGELMADARAVTRFHRIDRVQYSTERIAGDGWFLLPASAEFSDPLFSVGLSLTLSSISRLMLCIEKGDPARPILAADLAGLEESFQLESKYIRKYTKATKRCFLNFALLHRAISLSRLFFFREGGYVGASTDPEPAVAAAWGVDDENIRGLIDEFHDRVMAIDFSKAIPDSTFTNLDEIIGRWDTDGFTETTYGRMRADRVYLNSIPRMMDYFWKARRHPLGLGKISGFLRVSRRWVESFRSITAGKGASSLPFVPGLIRDQIRALVQR